MGTDAISEAAVTAHNHAFALGAEVLVAAETLGAGHATSGEPTHAHTVTGFHGFHHRANLLDPADNFVAGDERVGGHTPFVAEHA